MQALKKSFEKGLNTLIKPKREEYEEDLIGSKVFPAGLGFVHRKDFTVKNQEG